MTQPNVDAVAEALRQADENFPNGSYDGRVADHDPNCPWSFEISPTRPRPGEECSCVAAMTNVQEQP